MQYNLHKTSYVSQHDPVLSDVKDQCHHLVPFKFWIFLVRKEFIVCLVQYIKEGKRKVNSSEK